MLKRPQTNKELRESLAIAENTINSLKGKLAKQRDKYRAAKKECHKLRNELDKFEVGLHWAMFGIIRK